MNDKVLIITILSLLGIGFIAVLFVAIPWFTNYLLPNWKDTLVDSGIVMVAIGLLDARMRMRVANAPKPCFTKIATISRKRATSLMAVLKPFTLVTKLPTFAKTILSCVGPQKGPARVICTMAKTPFRKNSLAPTLITTY